MTNWLGTGTRSHDKLGVMLQRLAGLFVGLSIGAGVARDFPSVGFWLEKFGFVLGFGLIALAHFRAKTPSQDSVQLRTK